MDQWVGFFYCDRSLSLALLLINWAFLLWSILFYWLISRLIIGWFWMLLNFLLWFLRRLSRLSNLWRFWVLRSSYFWILFFNLTFWMPWKWLFMTWTSLSWFKCWFLRLLFLLIHLEIRLNWKLTWILWEFLSGVSSSRIRRFFLYFTFVWTFYFRTGWSWSVSNWDLLLGFLLSLFLICSISILSLYWLDKIINKTIWYIFFSVGF